MTISDKDYIDEIAEDLRREIGEVKQRQQALGEELGRIDSREAAADAVLRSTGEQRALRSRLLMAVIGSMSGIFSSVFILLVTGHL